MCALAIYGCNDCSDPDQMTLSPSCCWALDTHNLMLISNRPCSTLMTRVNGVNSRACARNTQKKTTDSDDQGRRVKNQNVPETKSNIYCENVACDDGLWEGSKTSLNPGSPRVSRGSEPAGLNQNQDNLSHSSLPPPLLPILLPTLWHHDIVPVL